MNTQSTVEQLQHLKLFGMSRLYQAIINQPGHQHPEAHTLIGMLGWHIGHSFTFDCLNFVTTRCPNK